ncbi:MAG: hypothetical protein ABFQ62_02400 [Patescibacteria group bacterium]
MKYKSLLNQSPKIILGLLITMGYRLIPVRLPNVEPILCTTMPFAKKYGNLTGFFFPFLSIFIYDLLTSGIGQWTFITATTYALLGLGASYYFKNRESKAINYLKYAIFSTLIYDGITGLSIGPLMFGQNFSEAFIGQLPFTAYHLVSNMIFAVTLSPLIYKWIISNKKLEFNPSTSLGTSL